MQAEIRARFTFGAWSGKTDPGRVKIVNEDAILMLPEYGVFCVADGMGGHEGGKQASEALVDALQGQFPQDPASDRPGARFPLCVMRVCQAAQRANHWIRDYARAMGVSGTGATFIALVFSDVHPEQAMVLHAGDSRAYRLRGLDLERLTADHSVAEELGLDEHSPHLPHHLRGAVTRAVGSGHDLYLDKKMVDVQPGDLFMLCSDGLSRFINPEQIGALLLAEDHATLDAKVHALIAAANEAGGKDNVSVILIRA